MIKALLTFIFAIAIGFANGQSTKATFYGNEYNNRRTASGEIFDQNKLTCASNIYPLCTILKVTNPENYKSVIVK